MTNETLTKFLALPETLKRRNIIRRDNFDFGVRWLDRMIRDFDTDPKPMSITYYARINLDGYWHDGYIEVDRNGNLAVSLEHNPA